MAAAEERRTVCVTGAGGFLGSWLVNLLLYKGCYVVHGTMREPSDPKNAHLKKMADANEYLRLFKVDLLDYDSVASAIAGCEGVFHVASPVPSKRSLNPEVEVITPAVTGTLNVLKACSEFKVKRVVVVSSVVAVGINPNWPQGKIKDENCWSDAVYCQRTENWYYMSKTLAEREALDYAERHGLDVVTICPSFIFGPLLQSTVNASSLFLISLLKGGRLTMENKVHYIVDVRDVADALLLLYHAPEASGRYICSSHSLKARDLVELLKSLYPHYKYPEDFTEVEEWDEGSVGPLYSEKLKNLGWKWRTLKESLIESIESFQAAGLLDGV